MVFMSFRATSDGRFVGPGFEARCVLGRRGVVAAALKREGDSTSPAGRWPLRRALYRPDREEAPRTALPLSPIEPDDGWCDAPEDAAYNHPVKLPYRARAERLWRDDHAYDLVVVLGHNDDPVLAGCGSAVFLHLAQPDWRPTQGCVAMDRAAMLLVLNASKTGDILEISER
jgi:L,D-peptidoglycan transpeptidase YkuD (ErfK/YbiS/YcfS/YnhG family)